MRDINKIPADGFEPSEPSDLHASSEDEHYPWSVQARVIDGRTMWVAFDASSSYESAAYHSFEQAEIAMFTIMTAEAYKEAAEIERRGRVKLNIAAAKSRRTGS